MSPTSCRCSTPRVELYPWSAELPSHRSGSDARATWAEPVPYRRWVSARRGRCSRCRWCWCWCWRRGAGHQVQTFVGTRVPVEPRLFLVCGARDQGLNVSEIALVLSCQQCVLLAQVRQLPIEPVADVCLLSESVRRPGKTSSDHYGHESAPY